MVAGEVNHCDQCGAPLMMGLIPLKPGLCSDCKGSVKYGEEWAHRQAQAQMRDRIDRWGRQMKRDGIPAAKRRQVIARRAAEFPQSDMAQAIASTNREVRDKMTNDIAVREAEATAIAIRGFTEAQITVIKDSIMPGAADAELELFIERCKQSRLNPLKSPPEIYAVRRKKNFGTREHPDFRWIYVIQTGIQGYRLAALRTRKLTGYRAQAGPQWCGEDSVWKDVWMSKRPPCAARVGIWIEGVRDPMWAVAKWEEFASVQKTNPKWEEMPSHMLAIAAEREAIRRACPNVTEGIDAAEGSVGVGPITGEIVDAECSVDPEPSKSPYAPAAQQAQPTPAPAEPSDTSQTASGEPEPIPTDLAERRAMASKRLTEDGVKISGPEWVAFAKTHGWPVKAFPAYTSEDLLRIIWDLEARENEAGAEG